MNTLFAKLRANIGPDFDEQSYTCLVTLYGDGTVGIPRHSDDERQILPDSKIFTISIGAKRTMRFVNKSGVITEKDVSLEHGSIFAMEASSQSEWSHSLITDHSVMEPRVSFTFRKLCDPEVPAQQSSDVPPIGPPTTRQTQDSLRNTQKSSLPD